MPPSYLMPDVIVTIPGITGSVLRKDNRDIWNISGSAVFNALRTLGNDLQELKLEEDPVDVDDVDGITAPSVIRDIHLIPGITGSVLRKDNRDIWNISGSAVFNALRTLGNDLRGGRSPATRTRS